MSAAPQVRTALTENLKALHLPAMRECFEQAAQQAEKETLSYEQYLLELSERECESRRRNRIAALLRESGLPREKTMANFDLKRLPVKAGRQLKALVDGSSWIARRTCCCSAILARARATCCAPWPTN
jgi:DNA replication protein DnaC